MTADLLWPGLHRAGDLFTDAAVLVALVEVEAAWVRVLEDAALAPAGTAEAVSSMAPSVELIADIARDAEGGGNPLIPLLPRLRDHVRGVLPEGAGAVHLSLTSQDVVDTALILCARACLDGVSSELDVQVAVLAGLTESHRDSLMTARTVGQAALPTTFGARAATWLRGLLAARSAVAACRDQLPVQVGGAAGTLAATVEVCRTAGFADPVSAAGDLVDALARELGLRAAPPWHTTRAPVTSVGDVLVQVSDALGHIANDVVLQSRPEVAELSEPAGEGRGVSSAMPQKRNPVLSVLIRRHARSAPLLGAQLHLAASGAVDERPDGAWHTEWAPLRDLSRRTVAATRQATELLGGLEVHQDAMLANLDAVLPAALSERVVPALALNLTGGRDEAVSLVASAGSVDDLVRAVVGSASARAISDGEIRSLLDPMAYLGACHRLVDDAVAATRTSGEPAASHSDPTPE